MAAVAEQPRTLLDEIGGPEVTRRAARHAIIAVLAEADPELTVRPLFARLPADSAVDAHIGHLARSFQQLFGGGHSGHPLTEELLRSWHPTSAGRCTRRQLDAVSAHVMNGFTLACPNEEAGSAAWARTSERTSPQSSACSSPPTNAPHRRRSRPRPPAASDARQPTAHLPGPARSAQALDHDRGAGPTSPRDERSDLTRAGAGSAAAAALVDQGEVRHPGTRPSGVADRRPRR